MGRSDCRLGTIQLPFGKPLSVFHPVALLVPASAFTWGAVGEATGCLPSLWDAWCFVGEGNASSQYAYFFLVSLGILGTVGWRGNSRESDLVNSSIAFVAMTALCNVEGHLIGIGELSLAAMGLVGMAAGMLAAWCCDYPNRKHG